MNSTWATEYYLNEMMAFFAYFILTLMIELGIFAFYCLLKKKTLDESLTLLSMLLIANFVSFLVGLAFYSMRMY